MDMQLDADACVGVRCAGQDGITGAGHHRVGMDPADWGAGPGGWLGWGTLGLHHHYRHTEAPPLPACLIRRRQDEVTQLWQASDGVTFAACLAKCARQGGPAEGVPAA